MNFPLAFEITPTVSYCLGIQCRISLPNFIAIFFRFIRCSFHGRTTKQRSYLTCPRLPLKQELSEEIIKRTKNRNILKPLAPVLELRDPAWYTPALTTGLQHLPTSIFSGLQYRGNGRCLLAQPDSDQVYECAPCCLLG